MSFRPSHLVGDPTFDLGDAAVAAACSLWHDHVFPPGPNFGSVPKAEAARERRLHHIEHLLFACQYIPGLDSPLALALLQDDIFPVCSGTDHAEAVLLASFLSSHTPVVAATACVVPFLPDPAAALSRVPPWPMKLQCLDLVAAFLLSLLSAVCTRQSPKASMLALSIWFFWLHACLMKDPFLQPPEPTKSVTSTRNAEQGILD